MIKKKEEKQVTHEEYKPDQEKEYQEEKARYLDRVSETFKGAKAGGFFHYHDDGENIELHGNFFGKEKEITEGLAKTISSLPESMKQKLILRLLFDN